MGRRKKRVWQEGLFSDPTGLPTSLKDWIVRGASLGRRDFGEPKIKHPNRAALRDLDVGGLQVAMDVWLRRKRLVSTPSFV